MPPTEKRTQRGGSRPRSKASPAADQQIDKETLIVHGRDDKVIPLENSYRLLQLIDRSQLHVFGHCGHWVQIEQAAPFVRLVDDFISH